LVGNVSTRLPVGAGDNVLIEGFIVQGAAGSTKKILVRAIGPSLAPFGIADALANPLLEIQDSSGATVATNNDQREPENSWIRMYSLVGQHSLVLGNKGLNQLTSQVNHLSRVSDVTSNITGEHYTRDFPNVHYFLPRLSFPTVNTGAGVKAAVLSDSVDHLQASQATSDLGVVTVLPGQSGVPGSGYRRPRGRDHWGLAGRPVPGLPWACPP
jgi:hypothetical protein